MAKIKAKSKTLFVCQECGYETSGWLGRCPSCQKWNTFVEEIKEEAPRRTLSTGKLASKPAALQKMDLAEGGEEEGRLASGMEEFDRILGGGIVPGSVVLVGGDPGVGKSTIMLEIANLISSKFGPVLYVSGEESVRQTRMRARRVGALSSNIYILPEVNLEKIEHAIEEFHPQLVIIDSIQALYRSDLSSAPGTISQVRECAGSLVYFAKAQNIPMFIVGHVTKDGSIAGPRVLEHMVDTVLYFEGDLHHQFRILRAVKNRFGSTNEIGVFEMKEKGLVEVKNPSEIFLAERPKGVAGSVVVPCLEGTRPLLVEVQALLGSSSLGVSRRMVSGFERGRASIIFAILEKRIGLSLANQDIFVNVAGGVKIEEPAMDLGVCVAVASSFKNKPVPQGMVVVGEVGLAGEVRGVTQIDKRIKEAARLGFKYCLFPKNNTAKKIKGIELKGISKVEEALKIALA